MQLKLYHYWRSSCSWRVRWALALKDLPYESIPVDILAGEHQSAAYLAKNPSGLLPCLDVGGTLLGESLAILEWLEDVQPTPALLPKDPLQAALARQLALTVVAGTQPLQNPKTLALFLPDALKEQRPERARTAIRQGLQVFRNVRSRAKPLGPFSLGPTVTVADLCLIPQLYNARRFDIDPATEFPELEAIYQACMATPACQAAAPERQPGAPQPSIAR